MASAPSNARAARELAAADGATFVLREGDFCYCADEDAISPLWKGSPSGSSARALADARRLRHGLP